MKFEYYATITINADLEVENVGNCAIQAFNDEGQEFALIIETNLGTCRLLSFGPVTPDFDLLPEKLDIHFERVPFNEKKLHITVTRFLNDPHKKITQAFEKSKDEILKDFPDLKAYLNQVEFW